MPVISWLEMLTPLPDMHMVHLLQTFAQTSSFSEACHQFCFKIAGLLVTPLMGVFIQRK